MGEQIPSHKVCSGENMAVKIAFHAESGALHCRKFSAESHSNMEKSTTKGFLVGTKRCCNFCNFQYLYLIYISKVSFPTLTFPPKRFDLRKSCYGCRSLTGHIFWNIHLLPVASRAPIEFCLFFAIVNRGLNDKCFLSLSCMKLFFCPPAQGNFHLSNIYARRQKPPSLY